MKAFAESEERLFQQVKPLTKGTSNNQPGNIISNVTAMGLELTTT